VWYAGRKTPYTLEGDLMPQFTRTEFSKRFVTLVLAGSGVLPNKPIDRQILLASAVLGFTPGRQYTEGEVNNLLLWWTHRFGASVGLDPISLRRALVDGGYLQRDRAGRAYTLAPDQPYSLDLPAEGIDLEALVDEERAAREERKRRYSGG
jgi:hypothetical protein